jgi:protein-tyrosine phosphatase
MVLTKLSNTAVVTAYVMKTQNKTYEEALAYVIERRPVVCPNAGFREQLQRYEASLKASGCSVM